MCYVQFCFPNIHCFHSVLSGDASHVSGLYMFLDEVQYKPSFPPDASAGRYSSSTSHVADAVVNGILSTGGESIDRKKQ